MAWSKFSTQQRFSFLLVYICLSFKELDQDLGSKILVFNIFFVTPAELFEKQETELCTLRSW